MVSPSISIPLSLLTSFLETSFTFAVPFSVTIKEELEEEEAVEVEVVLEEDEVSQKSIRIETVNQSTNFILFPNTGGMRGGGRGGFAGGAGGAPPTSFSPVEIRELKHKLKTAKVRLTHR